MEAALELPIQSPGDSTRPDLMLPIQGAPPQHDQPLGSPQSPQAQTHDVRLRRTPPMSRRDGLVGRGVLGERVVRRSGTAKSRMRLSPKGFPRSLLPVTEKRSQEENKLDARGKKEGLAEKWDITPDGGSAGREGRQFTVANVGNNGRIYLRYAPNYASWDESNGACRPSGR